MSGFPNTSKSLVVLGWVAIILFVFIYGIELLPHHGAPITIRWIHMKFGRTGFIVLNILMVVAFLALLPYRCLTKHIGDCLDCNWLGKDT